MEKCMAKLGQELDCLQHHCQQFDVTFTYLKCLGCIPGEAGHVVRMASLSNFCCLRDQIMDVTGTMMPEKQKDVASSK